MTVEKFTTTAIQFAQSIDRSNLAQIRAKNRSWMWIAHRKGESESQIKWRNALDFWLTRRLSHEYPKHAPFISCPYTFKTEVTS